MRYEWPGRVLEATRRHAFWLVLAIGLPAVGAYYLLPPAIENVAYEAFGTTASLAVLLAIALHRPRHARLWLLVGAGFALWTTGDVISTLLSPDGGDVPVPSAADMAYVAGYVLLIAGALRLAGPVLHVPDLARPALLDAAILATASGFAVWLLLVNPVLGEPEVSVQAAVVSAAYPILDVLLIAVVARHLLINGPKPIAAILLATGLASYLVADLVNVGESLFGSYSSSDPVNAGWLLGYVIMAAGVLHPTMRLVGTTDEALHPMSLPRKALIATAAIFPAAVILIHDVWSISDRAVLGIGSAVLVGLVLVRLFGALHDQQRLRQRMAHQATHDALTGLGNRALFNSRLEAALANASVGVGVLFMDLDGFKAVNDNLGHAAGDALLRAVATRLLATLRVGDDVARPGGDEFAVILEDALNERAAAMAASRVLAAMEEPMTIDRATYQPRVSIGIAWTAPGALSLDALLRQADLAMYAAKAAGGGARLFDVSLETDPSELARRDRDPRPSPIGAGSS